MTNFTCSVPSVLTLGTVLVGEGGLWRSSVAALTWGELTLCPADGLGATLVEIWFGGGGIVIHNWGALLGPFDPCNQWECSCRKTYLFEKEKQKRGGTTQPYNACKWWQCVEINVSGIHVGDCTR